MRIKEYKLLTENVVDYLVKSDQKADTIQKSFSSIGGKNSLNPKGEEPKKQYGAKVIFKNAKSPLVGKMFKVNKNTFEFFNNDSNTNLSISVSELIDDIKKEHFYHVSKIKGKVNGVEIKGNDVKNFDQVKFITLKDDSKEG